MAEANRNSDFDVLLGSRVQSVEYGQDGKVILKFQKDGSLNAVMLEVAKIVIGPEVTKKSVHQINPFDGPASGALDIGFPGEGV